jgi:hypothetical protein
MNLEKRKRCVSLHSANEGCGELFEGETGVKYWAAGFWGGKRHCIQGPGRKGKEGGKGSRKYLKKYFAGSEKIATFAAPQEGKRKEEKDRRRQAEGDEIKKRGCRAGMRRDTARGRKRERKAEKFFKEMIHVA